VVQNPRKSLIVSSKIARRTGPFDPAVYFLQLGSELFQFFSHKRRSLTIRDHGLTLHDDECNGDISPTCLLNNPKTVPRQLLDTMLM